MTRTIKFRGRDIDTGEFVYAELGQISAEINDEYLSFITDDAHLVDTDSIAQFVGYDANGNEVYEGDTVIGDTGDKFTVHFHPLAVNDDDCIDMLDGKFSFKLKEATK